MVIGIGPAIAPGAPRAASCDKLGADAAGGGAGAGGPPCVKASSCCIDLAMILAASWHGKFGERGKGTKARQKPPDEERLWRVRLSHRVLGMCETEGGR